MEHLFVSLVCINDKVYLELDCKIVPPSYFEQKCYLCDNLYDIERHGDMWIVYGTSQMYRRKNTYTCQICLYTNHQNTTKWVAHS